MDILLLTPFLVLLLEVLAAPIVYLRFRSQLRSAAAAEHRRVQIDDLVAVLRPVTYPVVTLGIALAIGIILGRAL